MDLYFRWKWLYIFEGLLLYMRSKKDISNPKDNNRSLPDCVLPSRGVEQDGLIKAECNDSGHGDGKIREGEQVYAIIAEENEKLVPRSIACRECAAQSIYEYVEKDTQLYVVSAVLEPEVCHGSDHLKLTRITILDEFAPFDETNYQ